MVATAVFFASSALWSLGIPLGVGADEPTHVVKAAATVRGEFLGEPIAHQALPFTTVRVPEAFAVLANPCNPFDYLTPGCTGPPAGSSSGKVVTVVTTAGRYQPLYYLVVGLPTLVSHSPTTVLEMRLLSALICAFFLGLAFAAASRWARSRLLVASIAVALTPATAIWFGLVNPSALEIASAVAVWMTWPILLSTPPEDAPPGLLMGTVISSCVLVSCRTISVLWLVLALTCAVLLSKGGLRRWFRVARFRRGLGAMGVVIAANIVFVLIAKSYVIWDFGGRKVAPNTSSLEKLRLLFGLWSGVDGYFAQAISALGWFYWPMPGIIEVITLLVVGGLLVFALSHAQRRGILAIAMVGGALILVPVVIPGSQIDHYGEIIWQERYAMPVNVGLPIVCAFALPRVRYYTEYIYAPIILALGATLATAIAFYWTVKRFTVGSGGVLNVFTHVRGGWHPQIPMLLLLVLALAALTAQFMLLSSLLIRVPNPRVDAPAPTSGAGGEVVDDDGDASGQVYKPVSASPERS
jgi:hypothetical protein